MWIVVDGDVVEFKGSGYRRGRPVNVVFRYNETEFYDIIYQPELVTRFTYKNGNNYELYNSIIWAKFVKNEVFSKSDWFYRGRICWWLY